MAESARRGRGGGGAARRAARSAVSFETAKYIERNIPNYEVLTEEALQKAGVAPARVLEIGSRESIRQAILCNLGVSLIPSREVPAHAELATVAIADTEVLMHEYLYCLRERQPVQLIARFLELAPSAA